MKKSVNIKNKKASFEYFFLKELTAGIQLIGSEVKSIRDGKVSLVDSFCYFNNNELILKGMNIAIGKNAFQHEPLRERKLLLKRQELDKLFRELDKGMTIIVTSIFSNEKNLIKVNIALAQGKKLYDKRESLKEKDFTREMKQTEY